MEGDTLSRLVRGDKAAWDRFVGDYSGLILASVRRVVGQLADVDDIAQDVFVRLCKDDYRLLKQFDPSRAALSTWLTIISRSVAHDGIRRKRGISQSLDETPEALLSVEPAIREQIKIPEGLLSPRQKLILAMLYDHEMDVAEIAAELDIDAQTVRSTHHKAMRKLRAHFSVDELR